MIKIVNQKGNLSVPMVFLASRQLKFVTISLIFFAVRVYEK